MNLITPTFLYNSTEENQDAQRLRIFAGPNGSGKSTIIQSLRETLVNGKLIDFGHYVNADDIAQELLRTGRHSLQDCWIGEMSKSLILDMIQQSGLLTESFGYDTLGTTIEVEKPHLYLLRPEFAEQVAQMIADIKRRLFLYTHRKFSFETVFSHPGKVDFMRLANFRKYKVYFYFVGTESPEINLFRVASRVQNHGHNVPRDKIVARYLRAMNLMWSASQYAYRTYFFDNSLDDQQSQLFASFRVIQGKKVWEIPFNEMVPIWFKKYYRNESADHFHAKTNV